MVLMVQLCWSQLVLGGIHWLSIHGRLLEKKNFKVDTAKSPNQIASLNESKHEKVAGKLKIGLLRSCVRMSAQRKYQTEPTSFESIQSERQLKGKKNIKQNIHTFTEITITISWRVWVSCARCVSSRHLRRPAEKHVQFVMNWIIDALGLDSCILCYTQLAITEHLTQNNFFYRLLVAPRHTRTESTFQSYTIIQISTW